MNETERLLQRANNCSKMLSDTLTLLRASKPDDRSETARRYAITITEFEKVVGYFETWVVREMEGYVIHEIGPRSYGICFWRESPDTNAYTTECGGWFNIEVGNPKENGMIFCPYCGRQLVDRSEFERDE